MIAITLNFKSIEAARQALLDIPSSALIGGPELEAPAEAPKPTAARKAAQAASSPATASKAAAPAEKTPASDTSATTSSAAASGASEGNAAAASTPAPAAETSTSPASSSASSPSVDYPTLQKAVFALAGKSREAAAAVAASFGVKTFKELDASKWGDALGAVQEKLAELENV